MTTNAAQTSYPFVIGEVLYQYESDWGNGSPGPWIRSTLTHYKWQDNAAYLNANLLNTPTSICIPLPGQTACTPSSSTTASYVSNGYDENNGSPQGAFGNKTSSAVWIRIRTVAADEHCVQRKRRHRAQSRTRKGTQRRRHTMLQGFTPSSITAPSTQGISHVTKYRLR